jgi:hypothetical protein
LGASGKGGDPNFHALGLVGKATANERKPTRCSASCFSHIPLTAFQGRLWERLSAGIEVKLTVYRIFCKFEYFNFLLARELLLYKYQQQ